MDEDKNIDEGWKESVEKEKQGPRDELSASSPSSFESSEAPSEAPSEGAAPEFNFMSYITSLALQAMIFMGEIPNPVTNQVEKNLMQTKFLIDTLVLLREKTKGNLDAQENDALNGFIYELQMKFVEVLEKEGKG